MNLKAFNQPHCTFNYVKLINITSSKETKYVPKQADDIIHMLEQGLHQESHLQIS